MYSGSRQMKNVAKHKVSDMLEVVFLGVFFPCKREGQKDLFSLALILK